MTAAETAVSHDPIATPAQIADNAASEAPRARASDVLLGFLTHEHAERIALGDLVARLGDRAFGMMLLILAIPNVVPLPGLSTAVGVPMLLLGAQMVAGWRQPWLPRRLAAVSFDRDTFLAMLGRAHRPIERVERHLRPRLPQFTTPLAERGIGVVVVVLAAVLCLPIFLGNLPPAIGIGLMALGLIERDGAFVLAGLIASALALVIVAAVVLGLGGAVWLLVSHAATL